MRGCETPMARVRNITHLQARLVDENAGGLTSKVVPNLSKDGLQMALCGRLWEWEG